MRGFSLVEVLVAMALVAVTASGLAELLSVSIRAVQASRIDTVATLAAEAKMGQLRALSWTYDEADPGLAWSPAAALGENVDGYVDYVNENGVDVGRGIAPPDRAVYLRRWSIQPLPADPLNSLVLQVTASRVTRPQSRDVHLVSILARTAR